MREAALCVTLSPIQERILDGKCDQIEIRYRWHGMKLISLVETLRFLVI